MIPCRFVVAAIVAACLPLPDAAADPWTRSADICLRDVGDPDEVLDACTCAIRSGRLSQADLETALLHRGRSNLGRGRHRVGASDLVAAVSPPAPEPGKLKAWTADPAPGETDGVYETTDAANLRIGPGTDRCSFRVLAAGTALRVTGNAGAWRRVRLTDGGHAYVHGDLLRPIAGEAGTPDTR